MSTKEENKGGQGMEVEVEVGDVEPQGNGGVDETQSRAKRVGQWLWEVGVRPRKGT